MNTVRILVVFAFSVSLTGCLSTLLGFKDSKNSDYEVRSPGPGWTVIDPGEADFAYRNSVDQAILNVSSICGEDRFSPLEDLANEILKQLPERDVIEAPKATVIGGHPGLIMEVSGLVDGNKLFVRLAVVRTSTCLFDIMLAGNRLDASSRSAFEGALTGFRESLVP